MLAVPVARIGGEVLLNSKERIGASAWTVELQYYRQRELEQPPCRAS
jgi:hypothetical protein